MDDDAFMGYYGLIQYLPRPERLEAINIGAYVFVPLVTEVRLSPTLDAIKVRFPGARFDPDQLREDARAIAHRIGECANVQELRAIAEREYGRVMVTPPLPMTVIDAAKDVAEVYADLVAQESAHG